MPTIDTTVQNFSKAFATNSTAGSFASKIPTVTAPTGDGVVGMGTVGNSSGSRNNLMIVPFGAGADTTTFDMRVIGWRPTDGTTATVWIPVILGQFSCTLSTPIGIAASDVVATDRFCDTITLTSNYGNANVDNTIVSPAADVIAHILIDTKGCPKVEINFDMTGATNGNALVAGL